jgi:hypothetical protein
LRAVVVAVMMSAAVLVQVVCITRAVNPFHQIKQLQSVAAAQQEQMALILKLVHLLRQSAAVLKDQTAVRVVVVVFQVQQVHQRAVKVIRVVQAILVMRQAVVVVVAQ